MSTHYSYSILVAGGAGFIGSHMVKYLLQQGHNVVVLDNFSTGHQAPPSPALLFVGDKSDAGLIQQIAAQVHIDVVMDFAAYIDVAESVRCPLRYHENNVVQTLAFYDECLKQGWRRIIFSSSAAVYGIPTVVPILESALRQPINPYGDSKKRVEDYLFDSSERGELASIIFRYFNASGSDPEGELGECHDPETHLIPRLLEAAWSQEAITLFGQDYPTHDGSAVRDFVHVWDICQAHALGIQALMSGKQSGVYNLGSGKGYSVSDVLRACGSVTGVSIPIKWGARREGDPPVLVADASLAQRDLDWRPRYTELTSHIEHAWNWFVHHRAKGMTR